VKFENLTSLGKYAFWILSLIAAAASAGVRPATGTF
jgi:hypothetical protein